MDEMDKQFTVLRREFNKLGARWMASGVMAASIHARYLHVPFEHPKQFDFIIGKHNRDKFVGILTRHHYEFSTVKSGRKNLRFEKRGYVPVNIHLADVSPMGMSYDSKIPLQKLENIPNTKRIINRKNQLRTMVNRLMRNINLNLN